MVNKMQTPLVIFVKILIRRVKNGADGKIIIEYCSQSKMTELKKDVETNLGDKYVVSVPVKKMAFALTTTIYTKTDRRQGDKNGLLSIYQI